ncbi:MAG: ferrous iron transport protein A, partial [Clostridia bacterium]|nr:ferrous iron transport protein A [Clostridia bacterium]
MEQKKTTLDRLRAGEMGQLLTVGGEGALRQHFLDMGLIPGAEVTLVKFAPMGDPLEVRIHDYELTLRHADAAKIEVKPIIKSATIHTDTAVSTHRTEHPG